MAIDLQELIRSSSDSDDRVRLVGSRCAGCGHHAFPSRPVCPNCCSRDQEEAELAGTGTVRAWTELSLPPAGFDGPIKVATVILDEGPSLFAMLTGEPADEQGEVEAIAHPVRDGAPGFAFRPVERAGADR